MNDSSQKDRWDKLQVVAALLVPLTVLFVGGWYSQSMKDSENRVKYVELAVSILRAEPKEENAALRAWAVDVLQKQASVPLSEEAQAQLKAQKLPVDYGGWVTQSAWEYNYKPLGNGNIDVVETRCSGSDCRKGQSEKNGGQK